MPSDPLVSILMPAYNAGESIAYSICSVLIQDYQNWELIIVDDGSLDNTLDIIKKFNDPRIYVHSFLVNKGRGAARQKCLELACGKYISMLDSDDWIYMDKLSDQVRFLEDNLEVALVSHGMGITNNDGDLVAVRVENKEIKKISIPKEKLLLAHAPTMFRYNIVSMMTYDSDFKLAQDMDFLRRISVGREYVVLPKISYIYEELSSVSYKKIFKGYYFNSLGYFKFKKEYPFYCGFLLPFFELLKIPYLAFRMCLSNKNKLLMTRSNVNISEHIAKFNLMKNKVEAEYGKHIGKV